MKIKTAPEDMIVGPTSPACSDSSSKNSGFSSSQTLVSLERQLRVCWTFAPQAFLLGLHLLCSKPAPRQSSCLVCVVWRHMRPSQAFVIEYAPARFVQAWWKMHPCRGNTADGLWFCSSLTISSPTTSATSSLKALQLLFSTISIHTKNTRGGAKCCCQSTNIWSLRKITGNQEEVHLTATPR